MSRKCFAVLIGAAAVYSAAAAAPEERPPAVSGHFYPSKPQELAAMVDRFLEESRKPPQEGLTALLVPHAALEYSGSASAKAFSLAAKGRFDSVVLVGTGHHKAVAGAAIYPGVYAAGEFRLPYDSELAEKLARASPLIQLDAPAHEGEHSAEVHIPFLARRLGAIKSVVMVMNTQDLEVSREVGMVLARVLQGRRTLLVVSSDLSHYPSGKLADDVDRTTLEALSLLDPAYFWLTNRLLLNRGLPDLTVSYCGEGAVTAVMTAARELGANRARLLARYNSGDVVSERDYHHVVGYAAMALIKEPGKMPPSLGPLTSGEKKELLAVARRVISAALHGETLPAPVLSARPRLNLPAAVRVALRDKSGRPRGASGGESPEESLVEAVAKHAVLALREAAAKPLTLKDLPGTRIEVTRPSPSGNHVFEDP